MAKVTNLSRVRKQRQRDARRAAADENSVRFGRTAEEKARDTRAAEDARRHVDDHQLERPCPDDPSSDP
ncbi:hypothetical protein ATO8_11159 [Roseivivax marinus]|uniref:Uncharacterized protein n=1 Tax=Roseivivax marinus TaxID=1379903 RepID=W4HIK3_9RHOB|nr:DUF4169 family protein [Roseivivax marinus]ETW12572.1 hypothetical protein ATO8_11159 [Roseivivax marinus]